MHPMILLATRQSKRYRCRDLPYCLKTLTFLQVTSTEGVFWPHSGPRGALHAAADVWRVSSSVSHRQDERSEFAAERERAKVEKVWRRGTTNFNLRVMAEVPSAALMICGGCGGVDAKKKCGGCGVERYCGEQCQRAHWPTHKARCHELKTEEAAAVAATAAAATSTDGGNCWSCGAFHPRNLCNRCKVTKYCGVACQTENWPIHKRRCPELAGQAAGFDWMRKQQQADSARGTPRCPQQTSNELGQASYLGRVADIERIVAAAAGGGRNLVNGRDGMGNHPLYSAATQGHACAIGVLVRLGAQLEGRNEQGRTAVHAAAIYGQLKAVTALLGHGAQMDATNNLGCSTLYLASENKHCDVMALLLGKGAKVDLPSKAGTTALCLSAEIGHLAGMRLLLEHGAQIDARDAEGASPLYWACQQDKPEVVALLLGKGARTDLPTMDGITPLYVSADMGHVACVRPRRQG